MYVREGWRGSFLLLHDDDWATVSRMDTECELMPHQREAWDGEVRCVDKWSRPFPCFVLKTFEADAHRICSQQEWTFIPRRSSSKKEC